MRPITNRRAERGSVMMSSDATFGAGAPAEPHHPIPIPLPPQEFIDDVGKGSDFRKVGDHLCELVLERTGLTAGQRILDIGSGCGRLAVPLTRALGTDVQYEGFDVMAPMVDWCISNITAAYPNFRFQFADLSNTRYRTAGGAAKDYRFPYDDASFDVVVSFSIFTHLVPESAAHYAREIARVLAPGGRALHSFYLIPPAYQQLVAEGRISIDQFEAWRDGSWICDPRSPEGVIGFDEAVARGYFQDAGLDVDAVSHGWWRSGQGWTYQDCIRSTRSSD